MLEREQNLHPDLARAYERDLPEVYLPPEVFAALKGQDLMFDRYELLSYGYRISPAAIRTFTLAAANGFYNEEGYHLPNTPQTRINAILYAFFNDFISDKEFSQIMKGKAIRGNLVEDYQDLFIGPNHPSLGNKVFGCVEAVALDIEKKRAVNPNFKVILFHGKWNCLPPHPGHMFCLRDVIQLAQMEHKINPQNLVTVVICDTNQGIQTAGHIPLLNTFWRTSLMSYWPYVDYACPSGEYPCDQPEAADRHWFSKYALLKPFIVNVAPDHPRKEIVLQRIRQVGARPMELLRENQWRPIVPGEFFVGGMAGVTASSRGIWDSQIDPIDFERAYLHMLFVKDLRKKMYGPRHWFPKGVLRPDSSRGLTPEKIKPLLASLDPQILSRLSGSSFLKLQKANVLSPSELVLERQHQILYDVLSNRIPPSSML